MTDETPTPTPRLPYHDSFRFLDAFGFEHIMSISAKNFDEMVTLMAEAESSILHANGTPLISANLRPSSELKNPVPAPAEPAPGYTVKEVKAQAEPAYVEDLPEGCHLFNVKEVYHDMNSGRTQHMLKVVLEEQNYEFANGKWGINCFHPEAFYKKYKDWELGKRFSPSIEASKVVIRDPAPGGKWADVVEFRPA